MDEYLAWAENYHHREQELLDKSFEDKSFEQDETTRLRLQHQALLELEQDEWSKNIVSVLMTFGAQETKQFFMLLNHYFVSSKHRLQIVYLLSGFLLRKYDNSTTLIAISVTNLIMLLPRICTSLPPFLPRLFYIFARALCWDQLRDIRRKQGQSADRTTQTQAKQAAANDWDCAENDFTIPEEFDEETFRARTIAQVTRHMLHPNLVMMDTETELTDRSRWMKMESPDIMAQIMSLDLTNAASRVAFSSAVGNVSGSQEDLLDDNVWKHYTDQARLEDAETSDALVSDKRETTESPAAVSAPPAVTVQSILQLHKALKSGTEVLLGDDVWDADLEHLASGQDDDCAVDAGVYPASGSMSSNETKLLIAALKREVLLLRNELNFELFVKQQHLQHMGRLHREHVSDSSVEAERQRTYNATRILKAQLAQATDALTKLKSESAKTKQKHVKWEDEQSSKLRNYRERWKAWQAEMEAARQQLADYEKRFADQNAQLVEVQQRAFDLENELKTREPQLKKAEELEIRVNQLTQQMLLWDKDLVQLDEQKRCIKVLLSEWQNKEELIRSLENTNKRLISNER
ncbi:hypothetical protein BCR43DRAFT_437222 [Syncephalastrum racemosum]|uniref:Hamartin protein-domain-containing protein n=1 Tax=Syncephalastrum racemosum TaxID=13706 RepID=A0A1X2HHM4_SYNRA|nr:hypothetical protein BCR43DRAFT_437222 [Syncephalastrum racemosum]